MNETIFRLIYLSRNEITGDKEKLHQEVSKILDVAREKNSASGITGALMFNSGCFAQVLEGAQDAVEETFERIQCDSRHSDVVLLTFEPTDTRAFDTWSMAYVGISAESVAEFDTVRTESGFDANKIPASRIFSIMKEHLLDAEGDDPSHSVAA